jgi:hypothetical protein
MERMSLRYWPWHCAAARLVVSLQIGNAMMLIGEDDRIGNAEILTGKAEMLIGNAEMLDGVRAD